MKRLLLAVLLAGNPQEPATLGIGSPAPDFDLPGTDGRRHALKDFASSRLLLVLFNTNHCPTAQRYEERVKRICDDYRPRGLAVVVISPSDPQAVRLDELGYTDLDDSFESMKIRARDRSFNFPYLYDGDSQEASRAYGPTATPHAFLFDAARRLRYAGRIDDNEAEDRVKSPDLRNAIDALLDGREVPVPSTRAHGCSTKWSSKRESVRKHLEKLAAEPVELEAAGADALKALLQDPAPRLRLIHVWSAASGDSVRQLAEFVLANRMYRRRKFELVLVSSDDPSRREEALGILRKSGASNRNLLGGPAAREALGPAPWTLLLAPGGQALYRKEGTVDPLEMRRAVVGNLK